LPILKLIKQSENKIINVDINSYADNLWLNIEIFL